MVRLKSAKNEAHDPSLPMKKRARWRLIGACVLAMGALIILPFALESEPRRELGEVEVRMPPRNELGRIERALPTGSQPPRVAVDSVVARDPVVPNPVASVAPVVAASGNQVDGVKKAIPSGLAGAKPVRIDSTGKAAGNNAALSDTSTDKGAAGNVGSKGLTKALPAVKPASKATAKPVVKQPAPKAAAPKATVKAPPKKAATPKPAPVKVAKASKPRAVAPPIPKRRTNPNSIRSASPSGYVVQIGAFSSNRGARAQVARGTKLGFKPYTERITTKKGDRIRVRIGPYLTKAQANEARTRLQKAGVDSALIAP